MNWWIWVVTGLGLLVLDILLLNIYYILWLGLAAIVIGGALLIFPTITLGVQIVLFSATSILLLVGWLKFKPKQNTTQLREQLIGVSGTVARWHNNTGTIRLQSPIGGKDEWPAKSSSSIKIGDSVEITEFTKGIAILSSKEKTS